MESALPRGLDKQLSRVQSKSDLSLQSTLQPRTTGTDDVQSNTSTAGGTAELCSESAKRVLKKIDWNLIPLLLFTYSLNFMDKSILSNAAVFGLTKDTVLPFPTISSLVCFKTDTGNNSV